MSTIKTGQITQVCRLQELEPACNLISAKPVCLLQRYICKELRGLAFIPQNEARLIMLLKFLISARQSNGICSAIEQCLDRSVTVSRLIISLRRLQRLNSRRSRSDAIKFGFLSFSPLFRLVVPSYYIA